MFNGYLDCHTSIPSSSAERCFDTPRLLLRQHCRRRGRQRSSGTLSSLPFRQQGKWSWPVLFYDGIDHRAEADQSSKVIFHWRTLCQHVPQKSVLYPPRNGERYPPPMHIQLRSDERLPRGIRLSVHSELSRDASTEAHSSFETCRAEVAQSRKRPPSNDSQEPSNKYPCLGKDLKRPYQLLEASCSQSPNALQDRINDHAPDIHVEAFTEYDNGVPTEACPLTEQACDMHSSTLSLWPKDRDSCWPTDAPRMLLAIRFAEDIPRRDMCPDLFVDWLQTISKDIAHVIVEAGFICDSTLLLVSMPVSLWTYLPHDPAIIPLGRVQSSNLVLPKSEGSAQVIAEEETPPAFPAEDDVKAREQAAVPNQPAVDPPHNKVIKFAVKSPEKLEKSTSGIINFVPKLQIFYCTEYPPCTRRFIRSDDFASHIMYGPPLQYVFTCLIFQNTY